MSSRLIYVHIYIYIYIAPGSGSTRATCNPGGREPGSRGMGDGSLLWVACEPRKYSVLLVYMIKQSRGVFMLTPCNNKRIRMQQPRASGAVVLSRRSEAGPGGSPGGPREVPGAQGSRRVFFRHRGPGPGPGRNFRQPQNVQ